MDYKEYNDAFVTKDIRKKVNHVVRGLWKSEQLSKWCIKKTSKTPGLTEMPKECLQLVKGIHFFSENSTWFSVLFN